MKRYTKWRNTYCQIKKTALEGAKKKLVYGFFSNPISSVISTFVLADQYCCFSIFGNQSDIWYIRENNFCETNEKTSSRQPFISLLVLHEKFLREKSKKKGEEQ